MFLDFSGAELTDKQKKILEDDDVQGVLKSFYEEREENTVKLWKDKVSEFRDTNTGLKESKENLEQKIKSLTEKLESKESGDDSKEVSKLTRDLADATAKVEKFTSVLKDKDKLISDYDNKSKKTAISLQVQEGIRQHNEKFPNAKVVASAEKFLIENALNTFKANDDGTVTAYEKDGSPIGNMQPTDWINGSFRENNSFCFEKATGSGAAGDNGGGASISSGDFGGDKKERASAIASKFPELKEA